MHTGGSRSRTASKAGRIDSSGQCVCDECVPCDGLTGACRPRYFDGQLLTAADFRRADQYVVAKQRLHNRYLHGVGVVCGLEAVCSPCDDTVTVRPGYALGPCGDDIVVSHDARVDVAALVKEQRAGSARAECGPYDQSRKDFEAARQQWILGVCYDERPARPVASLKRSGDACRCGGPCGGAASCGCGTSAPAGPAACEPTQICEGYRFTLTRLQRAHARPDTGRTPAPQGELPRLVAACLERLRAGLTELPQNADDEALIDYAGELKEELREIIETGSVHDCTLAQRLFDIPIPDARDEDAGVRARAALTGMLQITVDLFRDCVCSALLPPCGDGCADDCVPLAVLTVRSSDLRVLDICNWSARKYAITMPALQYWLGWIPVFGALRDAVSRLCCGPGRGPRFQMDDNLRVAAPMRKAAPTEAHEDAGEQAGEQAREEASTRRPTAGAAQPSAFVALAEHYREAWSSLSGLETTVLGALGARTTEGRPLATDLELDYPLAALTIGQLGVRAGEQLLPPDLARRFTSEERAEPAPVDRISSLEESLNKLRKTVDSQARTIRTLKARGEQ